MTNGLQGSNVPGTERRFGSFEAIFEGKLVDAKEKR
jgi:hypothetical protein